MLEDMLIHCWRSKTELRKLVRPCGRRQSLLYLETSCRRIGTRCQNRWPVDTRNASACTTSACRYLAATFPFRPSTTFAGVGLRLFWHLETTTNGSSRLSTCCPLTKLWKSHFEAFWLLCNQPDCIPSILVRTLVRRCALSRS